MTGVDRATRFACKIIELAKKDDLTKQEIFLSLKVAQEILKSSSLGLEIIKMSEPMDGSDYDYCICKRGGGKERRFRQD